MKEVMKKILLFSIFCIFSICSLFCFAKLDNRLSISFAETEEQINESIFIRNPEYSMLYNNELFFFDSYDNKIKVYNLNNESFDNSFIKFDYSIIDVSSFSSTLFFLAKKENAPYLVCLNLETRQTTELELDTNKNYTKIHVQTATIGSDEHFIVTLNSLDNQGEISPEILLLTKEYSKVSSSNVKFDTTKESLDEIQKNLLKLLCNVSDSEINLIFVYNSKISYSEISISSLSSPEITLTKASVLYDSLDSSNNDISIGNVHTLQINNTSHLLVTYDEVNEHKNQTLSKLYSFIIGDGTKTNFTYRANIESKNSKFLLAENNILVYPEDQTIAYKTINCDSEDPTNPSYSSISKEINNPKISVDYKSESDFVYKSTNKSVILTKTPWDSNAIVTLPEGYDVINIGIGKIDKTNALISDYLYCFTTINNTNYTGFISRESLTDKEIISLEDYKYKVVRVVPNSNLYSAPTKFVGTTITKELSSSIICQIKDNSRVKILDVITSYTANNVTFVKVEVNNTDVGYIDVSNIIEPSSTVDFILTNSSIKEDRTKVYIDKNTNSTVIGELKKGYRVRVNGKRDTKSGITCITYNDEYGNEFTGYIVTDSLKTDSWSTLQIIGCILIAVNIGLLILILVFKKNHIGNNGNKYLKNQKENYNVEKVENENHD